MRSSTSLVPLSLIFASAALFGAEPASAYLPEVEKPEEVGDEDVLRRAVLTLQTEPATKRKTPLRVHEASRIDLIGWRWTALDVEVGPFRARRRRADCTPSVLWTGAVWLVPAVACATCLVPATPVILGLYWGYVLLRKEPSWKNHEVIGGCVRMFFFCPPAVAVAYGLIPVRKALLEAQNEATDALMRSVLEDLEDLEKRRAAPSGEHSATGSERFRY